MNRLFDYLETNGILLCNANPYLPSLEDVGCSWADAAELIDCQLLFYSKAYKNRTTYLSREVYFLLKAVRPQKPLTPAAEWERRGTVIPSHADPAVRLREILSRTMTEAQVRALIGT